MLNPEQVMLVQSSWAEVEPVAHKVGESFYQRLFELDESAAALFKGNMQGQSKTLMSMIGMAVELLDHPESIGPAMKDLGGRHTGYGVQQAHIAPFCEALLWAMGQELGPGFSVEVKDAWEATLDFLFGMMQKGHGIH